MSDDMTHATWRVECEDGVREVLVSRHHDGWWNASTEINGRVARRISTTGARHAVTNLAAHLSWPVVSIAAPGARMLCEVNDDIDSATMRLREKASAHARLASTAMTDGDAMVRAASYEDALRIVREETGR